MYRGAKYTTLHTVPSDPTCPGCRETNTKDTYTACLKDDRNLKKRRYITFEVLEIHINCNKQQLFL